MEAVTFAGVLGAIAGSFLNVVAYRLPRHESLIAPASRCPRCGVPVRPYDNIPIVSYLLLRGRCRNCSATISRRYPLVEALTAGLCVGAVLALALGVGLDPGGEPARLIAGASAGGLLLIAALAYPGGMGMGDVKLAGVMGLFLGRSVAAAVVIALLSGVLVGALVIAHKGAREGRKTAVPFGPFLALGGLVSVFAGQQLVDVYVHHLL